MMKPQGQPINPVPLEQQIFEKKVSDFQKDLIIIQEKHGVMVAAGMNFDTLGGVTPTITYLPKKAFDKAQAQMQKGN